MDRFDQPKADERVEKDVLPVEQGHVSSDRCPPELGTLHGDGKGNSICQDQEKDVTKLTGKYAKYAGDPPDGGVKAWSAILACVYSMVSTARRVLMAAIVGWANRTGLTTCCTFGFVNTWGIFQEYYEEVVLPSESPSNIAWIGSIQYALILLPGLIMGQLFDTGYFGIPYLLASCLLIVCTFLVAECKEYWHFFVAQGIGIGLACGVLYGPTVGVVFHWFSKRRGLALGITTMGSSIGGTVFPIAAQNLIPRVGFQWTMRIFGFILILLLGVANLTLERRLPPAEAKGGPFDWAALRNPAYAIYCISGTTTYLGLYTALTYMPLSAVQVGISVDFSFSFIAIANGSTAFGRVLAGLLADRLGAINIMVPFTIVATAMTFLWPYVTTKGGLVAIAVMYGISCGTYVALLPMPAMAMGAMRDVGRRTGLSLSFAAFGALAGPPISGTINSATGGFEDVGWYAGGILLFSVCLMLLTKYLHLGKLTGKF